MSNPQVTDMYDSSSNGTRRAISKPETETTQQNIQIEGKSYSTDEWMNVPPAILAAVARRIHLQPDHPLTITRKLIESRFPGFKTHNSLFPVVTTVQNFDSLGFPMDHIGRSRNDTYYLNKDTVLRTHTSAHQADTFRNDESEGYLISADVYRRDTIDRSHYPIFHQMEGARTWDVQRAGAREDALAEKIWVEVAKIPQHNITVEDPNPTYCAEHNRLQPSHSAQNTEAMAAHLKRTLEDVVATIFNAAKQASDTSSGTEDESLKVRWVEAYFPFTSPSWELEVFWQGSWLEILGCGIVSQHILNNASVPNRTGWAFGLGLERIAMILYSIPDIRLFWSTDTRFLSQFNENRPIRRFVAFSKYPACFKDVSFWLPSSSGAAGGVGCVQLVAAASSSQAWSSPASLEIAAPYLTDIDVKSDLTSLNSNSPNKTAAMSTTLPVPPAVPEPVVATSTTFHENDVMELAREVCGDVVEDVRLTDKFTHPKTGRQSLCYRINYRSLERTLTNEETNQLHSKLTSLLVSRLGVELR